MSYFKIISTTLLSYALWLAIAFFAISGAVFAQSPYDAIKAKDGKALALNPMLTLEMEGLTLDLS